MRNPHLQFVLALVAVGPLLAMVGVSVSGAWGPVGVAAGAAVVAVTSWRSAMFSRTEHEVWRLLRLRMMAVTITVSVAASLLTIGALVWLATGR